MIHGSPAQRNIQKGWDRAACWQYAVDIFANCTREMEANDVTYCIEALTSRETNILTSISEALKMVADVGHPHFPDDGGYQSRRRREQAPMWM